MDSLLLYMLILLEEERASPASLRCVFEQDTVPHIVQCKHDL